MRVCEPALFCLNTETQDELEAITNDIKKMANNARNKLKSETHTHTNTHTLTHTHTHTHSALH